MLKRSLLLTIGVIQPLICQQLLIPDEPRWMEVPTHIKAQLKTLRKDIKLNNKVSPLFWVLDLDGDGRPDFVFALKGKEETDDHPEELGIWVKLSSQPHPIYIGCGKSMDTWGSMLFNDWRIFRHWQLSYSAEASTLRKVKGDYLELIREGVGSAILFWDGSKLQLLGQES